MSKYDPLAEYNKRLNPVQRASNTRKADSQHPHIGGHDANYRVVSTTNGKLVYRKTK